MELDEVYGTERHLLLHCLHASAGSDGDIRCIAGIRDLEQYRC